MKRKKIKTPIGQDIELSNDEIISLSDLVIKINELIIQGATIAEVFVPDDYYARITPFKEEEETDVEYNDRKRKEWEEEEDRRSRREREDYERYLELKARFEQNN